MGWVMEGLFLLGFALKWKGLNTQVVTEKELSLELL